MKLLLTSSGVSNPTIRDALTGLLRKPIAESNALVIPTGMYPFPGGSIGAAQAVTGAARSPLAGLGWKSLGLLELTALPSISRHVWTSAVLEADALLVWGGDPVYLSYWMKQSGLADLLPVLSDDAVYVGVSAGSIAMAAQFGETYLEVPECSGERLSSEEVIFDTPDGKMPTTLVLAEGVGLVDFMTIPHVRFEDQLDVGNTEKWAARLPVPAYAIDDQTAIVIANGRVDVVSEGSWHFFAK